MDFRIHHIGSERLICRDIACAAYLHGWQTFIDESSELGKRQAAYIRHKSGRRFKEERDARGLTIFHFPKGQQCFSAHLREYAIFQQRRPRSDFQTVPFDRFKGDWNETVAHK